MGSRNSGGMDAEAFDFSDGAEVGEALYSVNGIPLPFSCFAVAVPFGRISASIVRPGRCE